MRISDWSSDVCSSDLEGGFGQIILGRDCLQHRVVEPFLERHHRRGIARKGAVGKGVDLRDRKAAGRSEEHTSELQSLMRISYAVFCLKKKKTSHTNLEFLHSFSKLLVSRKLTRPRT